MSSGYIGRSLKNTSLFTLWGWGTGILLSNDIPTVAVPPSIERHYSNTILAGKGTPIAANMYVSLLGYQSFLVCCELRPTSIAAQADRMGKRHERRKKNLISKTDMQSSVQMTPGLWTQRTGKLGSCQFGGAFCMMPLTHPVHAMPVIAHSPGIAAR